jgi:serine/threonine-protein kinase
MADDPRVHELLDELLDGHATPEAVCSSCPELLPVVRKRWGRIRRVLADVDALFPPADAPRRTSDTDLPPPDVRTPQPPSEAALPRIPGYEVEAVLGRGGMGIVFRARHLRLNRSVALKMALAGDFAEPRERQRFQREAEAAAGLRHPNVVQIYDVGDTDGRPYLTMELVEGGSLAQKLAGTPQPAREAATLLAVLAGAVHAAHACGIIHRDLKPGNVLLTGDGVPKISDFGLARRLEGTPGLTQSGVPLGTPSYMAPEQARSQTQAIRPAVDVYALGAILYEVLTGRPPFRGETAAETVLQVISQDPVPPSRLSTRLPRDLETICLKCLEKEPGRRYVSAAALADDLRRFGEGRPIQARPVGHAERLWRWGRRNPTAAALLATALALIGLALGGGTWFVQQRAERRADAAHLRNEISTDVDQAASLRKGFHFREARELLEQARQRLQPAGPDDLRRQVDQALAVLDLVENLDKARLQSNSPVKGRFEVSWAEPLYTEAFANAGLGQPGDDSAAVAARVRDSAVRADIVAALDDWASTTSDPARRGWLLAVARGTDPDPLRDRLRQPELWRNGPALTKLVQETMLVEKVRVDELSPQLAVTLGRILFQNHEDAVPLLTAAHARHPHDFWLNFQLGWTLCESRRSDEALGYFRAAMALRPDAAPTYRGVGASLGRMGRVDEAIGYFQQALNIAPDYAVAHNDLGSALGGKRRLDEAIDHFREAIRLCPERSAVTHANLGSALQQKGRLDEAIDHFQEAVRLDPQFAWAHNDLGAALYLKGRLDDAINHCQEAIRLDPKGSARAHTTLGAALNAKGRPDDAIGQFQVAIRLDPQLALAHSSLGIVLRDKGRLDDAIDHFREAVRLDAKSAGTHIDLGNALRRKGRLVEAIDHLQEAVRLDPKSPVPHTNLGAALVQKGRLDEAMNHYEQAVRLDAKLVPAHFNLGLVLRDKGRLDEAIGHFQEVVGLDPNLAVARRWLFTCRYDAACAAVRAATGDGARQPRLDEAERVGLRRRALDWLRANIELTTELFKGGNAVDWSLSAWQTDPALAGVRDQDALAKLPNAEREQWQRLWADVATQLAGH